MKPWHRSTKPLAKLHHFSPSQFSTNSSSPSGLVLDLGAGSSFLGSTAGFGAGAFVGAFLAAFGSCGGALTAAVGRCFAATLGAGAAFTSGFWAEALGLDGLLCLRKLPLIEELSLWDVFSRKLGVDRLALRPEELSVFVFPLVAGLGATDGFGGGAFFTASAVCGRIGTTFAPAFLGAGVGFALSTCAFGLCRNEGELELFDSEVAFGDEGVPDAPILKLRVFCSGSFFAGTLGASVATFVDIVNLLGFKIKRVVPVMYFAHGRDRLRTEEQYTIFFTTSTTRPDDLMGSSSSLRTARALFPKN